MLVIDDELLGSEIAIPSCPYLFLQCNQSPFLTLFVEGGNPDFFTDEKVYSLKYCSHLDSRIIPVNTDKIFDREGHMGQHWGQFATESPAAALP
jgi:hypothetical protein